MKRLLIIALLAAGPCFIGAPARASLATCTNLYVLRIYSNMSDPRPQAIFGETPNASSGSTWTYSATGWTDRAYQQLLSILLTAKSTGKTVSVVTDASGGCDIVAGGHYLTAIELEKNG